MSSQIGPSETTGSDTNQSTTRAGDSEPKGPDTSLSTTSAISGDSHNPKEPDATISTAGTVSDDHETEEPDEHPSVGAIAVDVRLESLKAKTFRSAEQLSRIAMATMKTLPLVVTCEDTPKCRYESRSYRRTSYVTTS